MPRRLCLSTKSSVSTPFSMSAARFSRGATLMRISVVTRSPSDVKLASPDGYASMPQHLRRFEQRKSHHAGVTPGNVRHENRAETLNGIGTGLALRFATRPIGVNLCRRQRFKPHLRG